MTALDDELAELIGAFIGDGFIGSYGISGSHHVEFSGNASYEMEYYKHLSKIITSHFEVRPRFKIVEGTIRMLITYKELFLFFKDLGFPVGVKNYKVTIPEGLYCSPLIRYVIRGIFDTDGFFYLDKRGIYKKPYPRLGFSTKSRDLFSQVRDLFLSSGYSVYTRIDKRSEIYHLEIYGEKQIRRWLLEYGITNRKKEKFCLGSSVGWNSDVS